MGKGNSMQGIVAKRGAMVIVGIAVILVGASMALLVTRQRKPVTDFETCKAAGGTVFETYPEQCRANEVTYMNQAQLESRDQGQDKDVSMYIGMKEEEALAKAKEDSIPARVIERDNESLPVTMDYVFGRYNFHVKDGTVYKVDIEGSATDSPKVIDE